MLKNWSSLKDRLVELYPPIGKDIKSLEANLKRALVCADSCDPEGVGFGVDAAELCLSLIAKVEQLRESGVVKGSECGDFIEQIEEHCHQILGSLFGKYAGCVDEREKDILKSLVSKYSSMSVDCRDLVLKFAMEVRRLGWRGKQE